MIYVTCDAWRSSFVHSAVVSLLEGFSSNLVTHIPESSGSMDMARLSMPLGIFPVVTPLPTTAQMGNALKQRRNPE